jgi:hypothetical protein
MSAGLTSPTRLDHVENLLGAIPHFGIGIVQQTLELTREGVGVFPRSAMAAIVSMRFHFPGSDRPASYTGLTSATLRVTSQRTRAAHAICLRCASRMEELLYDGERMSKGLYNYLHESLSKSAYRHSERRCLMRRKRTN